MNISRLQSTAAALAALLLPGPASAADTWQWTIEPYLQAVSIDGDASVGRATGVEVSLDTSDILDNLDLAAMVHAEVLHASGWGLILDYGFMRLSDDLSGPLGGVVDSTVRQGVFEAMAFRRQPFGAGTLDLYAGIRWWDNDIEVEVAPALLPGTRRVEVEEDWVDPALGARYFHPVSERWTLSVQADIGGFGVGSDFSYAASAGAMYRFTETFAIDLKYRGLWVDYEDGTRGTPGYFAYDTVTHGPVVGLIINF
jgi:opacity protein-like surface antigen